MPPNVYVIPCLVNWKHALLKGSRAPWVKTKKTKTHDGLILKSPHYPRGHSCFISIVCKTLTCHTAGMVQVGNTLSKEYPPSFSRLPPKRGHCLLRQLSPSTAEVNPPASRTEQTNALRNMKKEAKEAGLNSFLIRTLTKGIHTWMYHPPPKFP